MADTTSTSATRTTKTSYVTPSGAPASALGQFMGTNANLEGLLKAATDGAATAAASSGLAAEREGAGAATAALARGEIQARSIENKRAITASLGTDQIIQDALVQRELATKEKDAAGAQLLEASQVAVWDDPLKWIANQLEMPKVVARHNAANMAAREATQRIDSATREAAALQNVSLPDVADQYRLQAAGEAAQAAFNGQQVAARALAESQNIRANGIMQLMASNRTKLEAQMQVQRMFHETEMASRADKEIAALAPALNRYNLKMRAMGQPGYSPEEFKFLSPQKKADIIEYGNNVTKDGTPYAFGDDPGNAYMQIVQRGGAPTIGQSAPQVFRLLVEQTRSKEANAVRQQLLQQNPKFKAAGSQEQDAMVLTALAQKQATDVDGKKYIGHNQLDDTNPYKLKLGNAAANPLLENNIFAKEVRQRIATQPLAPLKAEDLYEVLVAKAKVNPAQTQLLAQQFSEFFKEGTEGQWITSGAAQVAYPRPLSYKIAGVGEPDATRGIDTYSPTEIMHALTVRLARPPAGFATFRQLGAN